MAKEGLKRSTTNFWRNIIIAALAVYINSIPCSYATGYFDEHWRRADDVYTGSVFSTNPANMETNRSKANYRRLTGTNSKDATVTDNNAEVDRSFTQKPTIHQFGLLSPLEGGAAVSIGGYYTGSDDVYGSSDRNNDFEETFRGRSGRGAFIVDLTTDWRFGFAYQVTESRADLLGNFNINGNDRTQYLATLAGYQAGVRYGNPSLAFGFVYMPPLKGKAEIEGEQKIFIEPGLLGVELAYKPDNRYTASLGFDRYLQKIDERSARGSSPIDQRSISLRGMDIEQFLFPLERRSVGIEFSVMPNAQLFLGLNQIIALGFTNENEVAVKGHESGKAVNYQRAHVEFNFKSEPFVVSLGFSAQAATVGSFTDQTRWLSASNYEGIAGQYRMALIGFGYEPGGP